MMKRDDDHDAHRCHLTLTNEFILTLMRHWLEKGRQGSGCGCSSLIEMIAQSSSLALIGDSTTAMLFKAMKKVGIIYQRSICQFLV